MAQDVRSHPEAPDLEQIQNLVLEPIPVDEIRRRRENGEVLVEDIVNEREDLDVRAPMTEAPGEPADYDIGDGLYRLVQLFGTPQFPEYVAGEDITDRHETTFKYLFRATVEDDVDELPDEWLMTIQDWRVELGVSVCEWREDDEEFTADPKIALTSLALGQNVTNNPVRCDYEEIWY